MGVQWFGHRQLQWRGLCKNITKYHSEQEKVNGICELLFHDTTASSNACSLQRCSNLWKTTPATPLLVGA